MNRKFQEYKRHTYEKCEIVLTDHIDTDISVKVAEITIETERIKEKERNEYNRAKAKREVKKMIKEELDKEEER